VHEPPLLVLDEPTAGVDPQSRRTFWERIFELAAGGTTILVSTHYMDEAVRCHRLCMLRDGRRAALGTPAALLAGLRGRVVECRVDPIEAAIAQLASAPEVVSITQLGDTAHVLLASDAPPAEIAAETLRRRLEAAGFPGATAAPGSAALEDVFVALLLGERLDGATDAQGAA
jgi:ABC-2 type transport system ATP-binding protein